MLRVRSWVMCYIYESPHKDRNVCMFVCASGPSETVSAPAGVSGNAVCYDISGRICLLQKKLSWSLSSFHIYSTLHAVSGRAVFTAHMTCL